MKIAIAVQGDLLDRYKANAAGRRPNERCDDWLLKDQLGALGFEVEIVDWRDKTIDFKKFDAVYVSSTWNMHHHLDEFYEWLDACESDGKQRLINSSSILKLAIKKDQYLVSLMEKFGCTDAPLGSITPSHFIKSDRRDKDSLTEILQKLQKKEGDVWAGDIVIKPITSADGENTFHLTRDETLIKKHPQKYRSMEEGNHLFQEILALKGSNGVIIQPFIQGIEKTGEYQLAFFDGEFSHAIVKPPGFKNSTDRRRKAVAEKDLPQGMLEFAKEVMRFLAEKYPNQISRSRLDFFTGEKGPVLCEVELVEPHTNLSHFTKEQQQSAILKYAEAIKRRTLQLHEMPPTLTIKKLIHGQKKLRELLDCITPYAEKIKHKMPMKKHQSSSAMDESKAARVIQHVWRGKKIKEKMIKSPYFSYLSMIDEKDEQKLSAIMFGRHVAEIREAGKKIDNPYLDYKKGYNRTDVDTLGGKVYKTLLSEFAIPNYDEAKYVYLPLSRLKNTPIEEVLLREFASDGPPLQLIEDEVHSIAILAIPKADEARLQKVKGAITHHGLLASAWEMAENITTSSIRPQAPKSDVLVKKDPNLPKTKAELLDSEMVRRLNLIASSPHKYATQKLAKCLKKMLEELPELSESAIQRVALMLDLTNTFYSNHYPRYAYCVYAIVHEISIALSRVKDEVSIAEDYAKFLQEAETSMLSNFGLDKARLDEKSTFVAIPATSGMNAYDIAFKIAQKMKTEGNKAPTVKLIKPTYYEIGHVTTHQTERDDADIFVCSPGPIINEGISPGIDINKFVRRHIIHTNRTKHTTLLLDTTNALYRNLHLDPDVKALVEQGKLSILINESHQKFGLIHTDQAQYGRVVGWCAKDVFEPEEIVKFQNNAREDFNHHVDIRIGAFISSRCKNILEDIKEQHFTNGAILRNILMHTSFVSRKFLAHEDMMTNLNELYFINTESYAPEIAALGVLDRWRDSFGHYTLSSSGVTGGQRRLCPDATDDVDCLVQASHIYLSNFYSVKDLLALVVQNRAGSESLSLSEQVLTLSILHNIISNYGALTKLEPNLETVYAAIHTTLEACPLLKGRQYHQNICKELSVLENKIIHKYNQQHQVKNAEVLEMMRVLYRNNMPLVEENLQEIANKPTLCRYILSKKENLAKDAVELAIKLSAVDDYVQFFPLMSNKNYAKAIQTVFDGQQEIMKILETAPQKYQSAKAHSNSYLMSCYTAIHHYYGLSSPTEQDRKRLIKSLDEAKNEYCTKVLSKDRSDLSKAVRLILMGVVNVIVGLLTLGAAQYFHYRQTGVGPFFYTPRTEEKLRTTHKKLAGEIQQQELGKDSSDLSAGRKSR